jgi:hypothetical protein
MQRALFVLICVGAVVAFVVPAEAGCKGCEQVAAKGEGFCCDKGIAYGVRIKSKKLYGALEGKEVAVDKIKCPGCKSAVQSDGVCESCKVGIANGKMYHSMVAYRLAKGNPTSPEAMKCAGCVTAAKKNGFCNRCKVGFVANRAFKNKADFGPATEAHATLVKAAETVPRCEDCAVALVTDGTCAACKVSFKDGKKVESGS